jgi:predicted RND superfamily exporter protein
MVATGTKVGMYNMIVLPVVVGISIDGAIHLYHRFHEETRLSLGQLMRTTGLAVVAATLANCAGFVGLLFQQHMGIRSIGVLALIGMSAGLIAVILFMPGLLWLLSGRRHAAAAKAGAASEAQEPPASQAVALAEPVETGGKPEERL